VSGILGPSAVAGGLPLPTLWRRQVLAGPRSFAGVPWVWLPNFGDSRNDLPGYANSFAGLVPRHVVGDHPEERGQCFGSATGARAEELRDSLDVAA
jgi:hypothetical protein